MVAEPREARGPMSEQSKLRSEHNDDTAPIPFGRSFVASEAFRLLFREGMDLIEESAAYLDGPGREESRQLQRQAALAYAAESMRLTTRLMQVASWLLLQRAVAEGELTPEQAMQEKHKVKLTWQNSPTSDELVSLLPERMRELIDHSLRLQERVLHLDALLSGESLLASSTSPVALQLGRLQSAFSRH